MFRVERSWVLLFVCLVFIGFVGFHILSILQPQCDDEADLEMTDSDDISIMYGLKTVLALNPIRNFHFPERRVGFIESKCPVTNCLLTYNRSEVDDDNFDAIIFELPYFDESWLNRKRKPHQMYIFYSIEPPGINGMPTDLDQFEGYFNRTMSYLSDSDFVSPFGSIKPMSSAPKTETQRLRMMKNVLQPDYNPAKGKTKLAVWMAFNCETPSRRETYVEKLQNYIDVDIISPRGMCGGTDACPFSENYKDHQDGCRDMIESTYKFYLAFENSICRDYVTEKFYYTVGRNIVPIVLGGANYSALAPPHSYINAMDYTPLELAEYLLLLDQNDELYAQYFWWKPHYQVSNTLTLSSTLLCDVCAALHRPPVERKTINNLQEWFIDDSHCIADPIYESN